MANRSNRHNIVIALACITLGANPFGVIARFLATLTILSASLSVVKWSGSALLNIIGTESTVADAGAIALLKMRESFASKDSTGVVSW
jgi:hypothetical protein